MFTWLRNLILRKISEIIQKRMMKNEKFSDEERNERAKQTMARMADYNSKN
ncbi:MAG: hypothetical protein ABIG90_01295 [bacterium]